MKKLYCVYFAYSKYEILSDEECNDSNIPEFPRSLARYRIYDSYEAALDAYSNIMCPASQIFEADSEEEILLKIEELKNNFEDEDWLNEYIHPYC